MEAFKGRAGLDDGGEGVVGGVYAAEGRGAECLCEGGEGLGRGAVVCGHLGCSARKRLEDKLQQRTLWIPDTEPETKPRQLNICGLRFPFVFGYVLRSLAIHPPATSASSAAMSWNQCSAAVRRHSDKSRHYPTPPAPYPYPANKLGPASGTMSRVSLTRQQRPRTPRLPQTFYPNTAPPSPHTQLQAPPPSSPQSAPCSNTQTSAAAP